MREEDVVHGEAGSEAHHLAMRAFTAIEQHQVAVSLDRESADITANRGQARGSAEKRDALHDSLFPHHHCRPAAIQTMSNRRARLASDRASSAA
jgi:hypothetical protein